MQIRAVPASLALLLVLSAASAAEVTDPLAPLAGTTWVTTEIADPVLKKDGVHDHPATMTIHAARALTGFGVCNRYSMEYSPQPGGSLSIKSKFWTYMSCGEVGNMIELGYARTLEKVTRFEVTADDKLFGYAGAEVVLRFRRGPASQ